ncbi:hypothetical protein BC830DRAFT_493002 [Chytriomyces sp. MP71]|nr:hypothetical protein BC830DRAFT_493002 [Chytriomyces sp. MP71]
MDDILLRVARFLDPADVLAGARAAVRAYLPFLRAAFQLGAVLHLRPCEVWPQLVLDAPVLRPRDRRMDVSHSIPEPDPHNVISHCIAQLLVLKRFGKLPLLVFKDQDTLLACASHKLGAQLVLKLGLPTCPNGLSAMQIVWPPVTLLSPPLSGNLHTVPLRTLHLSSMVVDGAWLAVLSSALIKYSKTVFNDLALVNCNLTDVNAPHIAAIIMSCPLESLVLSQNSLQDEGLKTICAAFPFNKTLHNLDISANQLTSASLVTLADTIIACSPSLLQSLHIQHIQVDSITRHEDHCRAFAESLLHTQQLHFLDARHGHPRLSDILCAMCPYTRIHTLLLGDTSFSSPARFAQLFYPVGATFATAGLRELDLTNGSLFNEGLVALAEALWGASATMLECLSVNGCGVDDAGFVHFARVLPRLSALRVLRAGQNRIGDAGAIALGFEMGRCDALRVLDMERNQIGLEGGCAIATGLVGGGVVELQLGYNMVGNEGAKALAAVMPHASLAVLSLEMNMIGESGAEQLALSFALCPWLRSVNLRSNYLGDVGVAKLAAALRSLPRLESLNLEECYCGPSGAFALANGLFFTTRMQRLDLGGNAIGDEGCYALCAAVATLPRLEHLGLRQNGLTDFGVDQLEWVVRTRPQFRPLCVNLEGNPASLDLTS